MPEDVMRVDLEDKTVFLVGTAHISKKSAETVREVIDSEKPDVVAVELCEQRKNALVDEKKWDETEITDVIKSGRTSLFLTQLFLANFQRKLGDEVGVKPGAEMLEAVRIAQERSIRVELVDRDIRVTLNRAQRRLGFFEKMRLFYGLLEDVLGGVKITEETIEALKKKDMITELLDELSREVPTLKETLVDERDRYIAYRILALEGKKIVGVVGAGHVKGIAKILMQVKDRSGLDEEISALNAVDERKSRILYLGYIMTALFGLILIWGFLKHDIGFTLSLFLKWFWIHGILSAIGAAIAFGHPLTILTAFLVAPFTSLNPTIAAGWFAGAMELRMRKPRVADFKGLFKLNSVRDYWGNRVTRVFLVIVFANLGSSIGTFIALPYLAALI